MQRITKTQIAAIALAFVALTLSLVDWLFTCHLARYGLTTACDAALIQPIKSCLTIIWHNQRPDPAVIFPSDPEAILPLDTAPILPPATTGAMLFSQTLLRRLWYPFLHVHPLHALINVWVLLQVFFRTRLGGKHLLWAFLIAWSCPAVVATSPRLFRTQSQGDTEIIVRHSALDVSAGVSQYGSPANVLDAVSTPVNLSLAERTIHPQEAPPTVVGLSGVVYALLGMWMPYVARRRRYNAIVLLWLVAGAFTGTVAVALHLYCYLLGALLSLKKPR